MGVFDFRKKSNVDFIKKGRPVKSIIRQNIINILFVIREAYGYEIYKIYRILFPSATMRAIYYNLDKGIELEEFSVSKSESISGNYSWGKVVERTYYRLGKNASPDADEKLIKKINDVIKRIKL